MRTGLLAALLVVCACAQLELEGGLKPPPTGDDDDVATGSPTSSTPTPSPTPVPTSGADVLYESDFEADDGTLTAAGAFSSWAWGIPEGSPPNAGSHGGLR